MTIENTGQLVDDPAVWMLRNLSQHGPSGLALSRQANGIVTGQNSGYQAIGLAVLAGCTRIVLLGYDMKANGAKTHWHGGHPVPTPHAIFSAMLQEFRKLAPVARAAGIEIVNASPDSALDCFRKVTLESVLADSHAAALP